jgi:hypothetical protein
VVRFRVFVQLRLCSRNSEMAPKATTCKAVLQHRVAKHDVHNHYLQACALSPQLQTPALEFARSCILSVLRSTASRSVATCRMAGLPSAYSLHLGGPEPRSAGICPAAPKARRLRSQYSTRNVRKTLAIRVGKHKAYLSVSLPFSEIGKITFLNGIQRVAFVTQRIAFSLM